MEKGTGVCHLTVRFSIRSKAMRKGTRVLLAMGTLLLMASSANPKPKPAAGDDQGKIVVVFKDGHQQSFRLADVARIDFSQPARSTSVGSARFQGRWKVGDGAGGTFYITLKSDGKAEKTLGSRDGTWTVVNGEARVSWQDGWHDAIRKVGNKYQKAAFGPGSSFDDNPSNVADAEYTEPH
jgi:ABC-type sugar transport system substrate-binding protein